MRKPLKKSLHINDPLGYRLKNNAPFGHGVWSYKIGKYGVQIRTPDMKKTVYLGLHKILPGEYDGDEKVSIRPSDVKEYIKATDGLTHNPIWI